MRENWTRTSPHLNLGLAELTELIQPAFAGDSVLQAEAAEGGLVNTNLRLTLARHGSPVLARFWTLRRNDAAMEYHIVQRVAALAPVPRYYHFAKTNPVTSHPYAVMEWVEGERLELAVKTLPPGKIAGLGRSVGAALAGIHSVTFDQTGALDADLNVIEPFPVGGEALIGFVRHSIANQPSASRIGNGLGQALLRYAETKGLLLDTWDGPPCLTHGDYGGSNILVREENGQMAVAAVLDWEFAMSGSPFFDLANLLRPPVGDLPGFEASVAEGYRSAGGRLPAEWRRMSRIADLYAWLQFLGREEISDNLLKDCRAMIAQTIGYPA